MKSQTSRHRAAKAIPLFLLTLSLLTIGSCKKDKIQQSADQSKPTQIPGVITALQKLPESKVIHPNEIKAWVNTYLSAAERQNLKLDSIKQSVIGGQQVVKLPIGKDAALYFTKTNDTIKAYAYKWEAEKVIKNQVYGGRVFTFSYQSGTAKVLNYSTPTISVQSVRIPTNTTQTVLSTNKVMSLRTLLAQIWCWLTGGAWKETNAHGELGMEGCDYTSVEDSNNGGGESYGAPGAGINTGSGAVTISSNVTIGGVTYGGGGAWVTTNDGSGGPNPGCGPDGTMFQDPDSGCTLSPSWTDYFLDPTTGITIEPTPDANITDPATAYTADATANAIDENNNNSGNEDNTDYGSYQQGDPWATKSTIIPKGWFVGISAAHENCLSLAKQQIRIMGYQISNYGATGQTYQVYTEANGVDLAVSRKAVAYINAALASNIPVIVGVDDAVGGQGNVDQSTNHFVVIVGMGTDANGKYYQFYDSSTNQPSKGASPQNKLYYNSTTGQISGSTQSSYGTAAPWMYPYKVTQVRKSKKI
jgi:hypothetical protein